MLLPRCLPSSVRDVMIFYANAETRDTSAETSTSVLGCFVLNVPCFHIRSVTLRKLISEGQATFFCPSVRSFSRRIRFFPFDTELTQPTKITRQPGRVREKRTGKGLPCIRRVVSSDPVDRPRKMRAAAIRDFSTVYSPDIADYRTVPELCPVTSCRLDWIDR